MTDAPKRIWAFHAPDIEQDNPACTIVAGEKAMPFSAEYHHASLSADLVRAGYLAGLKTALSVIGTYDELATCSECCDVTAINEAVTSLSADREADPEAVAAIVAQVMEKNMVDWDSLMNPAREALEALIAKGDDMADRIKELEAEHGEKDEKLQQAEWLLVEAEVQLEEGKAKTRRNRADLIRQFLNGLKHAE